MTELAFDLWPLPRAAYIHVPFCRHRCGYCNFSVVADRDDLIERYLKAIDVELCGLDAPAVDTVFVGGGTPTHFDADHLRRFLQIVQKRFQLSACCEWSMEANPEDITRDKVEMLSDHGVNRISLGVQSFNVDKLRVLERGHSPENAVSAVQTVADVIGNVSIDLIFAAPGETIDHWRNDLAVAKDLPLKHISTYALTFEKGTSFWSRRARGDLSSASESCEVDMYQAARQGLRDAGFQHYEISSFAREGSQCRHNLAYWKGLGWYAVGPGAARFVDGSREVNHRSTTTYLRRMESADSPVAEQEAITREQCARERAAFGVRMIDGIDLEILQSETGIPIAEICRDAIFQSVREGLLLNPSPSWIKLSERGILFADTVASRLLG
ncbi:radical SAM family heme chaperone HemW [Rubripirellula sp.]|nr:radical SAM family heme chaperone HemW [Rubripirellula sp.]MDB4624768.1 radical SAM family heme chaperone HemW [Rubripirellula sp.]